MFKSAIFSIVAALALFACISSAEMHSTRLPNRLFPRPFAHYYFPVLGDSVTFDQAADECQLTKGYKLAGIETTNRGFLKNTVDLVKNGLGNAVWIGGYLNFSSPNRYLIHWVDGMVTVANRGPASAWCYGDVLEKIEDLYQRKPNSIVPIVRTKLDSKCLSLYSHDIDPSETPLPPLCVTNEAKVFIRNPDGDVVLPADDLKDRHRVFNLSALAVTDLHRKLNCLIMPKLDYCDASKGENGTTYRDIFVPKNYRPLRRDFYIGFLQMADFKTVEALCDVMRSGFDSSTSGHLMDITLLNSTQRYEEHLAVWECFNRTINDVATADYKTKRLGMNGARGYLPMPTTLYFNFTSGHYPEFVKLWSKSRDGKVELINDYSYPTLNRTKPLSLDWCYGYNILNILLGAYKNFEDVKPHMRNREHLLRVGVGGYGGLKSTPCLKLSFDDLYWPGSQAWITACQLPPYCASQGACRVTNLNDTNVATSSEVVSNYTHIPIII